MDRHRAHSASRYALFILMNVVARGAVLRRNWFLVFASLVLLVLGVIVARGGLPFSPFGYLMAWFGLVFAPVLFLRNAFPRARPTTVRASGSGIAIDGEAEVKSEDILEVKILRRRGESVVDFALRGGRRLSLRLREADAQALIAVLGARRTRFQLEVAFGKRFLACFTLLAGASFLFCGRHFGAWLMTVPACLISATLLGWLVGFARGRLVVGADGFTTRWLFRERFTAFRDVTFVVGRARLGRYAVEDTVVELSSGRHIRLRTIEAPNFEEERGDESRAMLSHMTEAFAKAIRSPDGHMNVPSMVEPGSRSAREWLSGLDALVRDGGARYRVAAISAEVLVDLTNDPSATIGARVGAAAALVRTGDDTHRARVRIAAEGCAESELRDTLLALSEAHDDAAAEAALAVFRR